MWTPSTVGSTALLLGALGCVGACGEASSAPRTPSVAIPLECEEQSPGELFAQRIEPLFAQDRPKTCNQCHLSGIDLAAFARDTPCETMACLEAQGLVDLDAPEESQILGWIERAHPDSGLITAEVIDEEHDGFLAWIRYTAQCGELVCAGVTCGDDTAAPFCEHEPEPLMAGGASDDGGCDDRALERLFRDTIYAFRGRCYPCHFSGNERAAPDAPRWIVQDGNCDQAALATMRRVIRRGYVNVETPEESLLLEKPLALVSHGGGAKFGSAHGVSEDRAYDSFALWLERYAACQRR